GLTSARGEFSDRLLGKPIPAMPGHFHAVLTPAALYEHVSRLPRKTSLAWVWPQKAASGNFAVAIHLCRGFGRYQLSAVSASNQSHLPSFGQRPCTVLWRTPWYGGLRIPILHGSIDRFNEPGPDVLSSPHCQE